MSACHYSRRHTAFARIKTDVDFIVVKVPPRREEGGQRPELVQVHILHIAYLLQPGVVLLARISVYRIVQKVSEVGIEIEQRPPQEAIRLKCVAVGPIFAVVSRKSAELH